MSDYAPFVDFIEGYKERPCPTKVHVLGWPLGCVFLYQGTENGRHRLKTPRSGKLYFTSSPLLHLKGVKRAT